MVKQRALDDLSLSPVIVSGVTLPEFRLGGQSERLAQLAGVFVWPAWKGAPLLSLAQRPRLHSGWLLLTALLHLAAIYWLVSAEPPLVLPEPPPPITVSIIQPPAKKEAPAPEIVPLVKPKPVIKPVVKPVQKPVEKVIERPVPVVEKIVEPQTNEPRFEATTEHNPPPPVAPAAAAPAPVETATKAAPEKKLEDEKEEPPKFGVAYLNNPPPEYPRMSRRAGEQGKVILKVLVNTDGSPSTVELSKSSGFERLDNAALAAVKQWRFEPARKGGKAISAYVLVPMPFILN